MAGVMDFLTAIPRGYGAIRQAVYDPYNLEQKRMTLLENEDRRQEDDQVNRKLRESLALAFETIKNTTPGTPEYDVAADMIVTHPFMPESARNRYAEIRKFREGQANQSIVDSMPKPLGVMDFKPGENIINRYAENTPKTEPKPNIWGALDFSDFRDYANQALSEKRLAEAEAIRSKMSPVEEALLAQAEQRRAAAAKYAAEGSRLQERTQPEVDLLQAQTAKNQATAKQVESLTQPKVAETQSRTAENLNDATKIQNKDAYGNPFIYDPNEAIAKAVGGMPQKTGKTQTDNSSMVSSELKSITDQMRDWGRPIDGNQLYLPTREEVENTRVRLNRIGYDIVGENGEQAKSPWLSKNTPAKQPTYRIIKLDGQGMPTQESLQSPLPNSGQSGRMVRVISPDGQTGTLPIEDLEEAIKEGYKQIQ